MIYETDSKQFALMMKVTWQSYGRNGADRETLRYWFDKLIAYEFNAVSNAFDEWIKSQKELPTVNEILKLCQHKVTIHARLSSPLELASNKQHSSEVIAYIAKNIKPESDKRKWSRDLVSGVKISNHPEIAIPIAKAALCTTEQN